MGYKHLSLREFKEIKQMSDNGKSIKQIANLTGRGRYTVSLSIQADTFVDYKRLRGELTEKYRNGVDKQPVATRKFTRTSEQQYDQIKMLANVNLSNVQIAKIIGKSTATVSRAKRTENWQDYQALLAKMAADRQDRLQAQSPEPTLEPINEPVEEITRKGDTEIPTTPQVVLVLQANADAMSSLALAFNHFSDKLDEVIETKRPWLGRNK
jgi:IS30 family transposase